MDALDTRVRALIRKERHADAEPLARTSLRIHNELQGPGNLHTIASAERLTTILYELGRTDEARATCELALSACRRACGAMSPRTAMAMDSVARVLALQGDLVRSRRLMKRSLSILESALGSDHPEVVVALNNLGLVMRERGEHHEARHLLERALASAEAAHGTASPNVAKAAVNLASVLRISGEFAGEEALLERARRIYEDAGAPGRLELASTLDSLGTLCSITGDFARARTFLESAIHILFTTLSSEHPEALRSVNNLALLLHDQGDLTRAHALYRYVLNVREQSLGEADPRLADSLANLATLLNDSGALDEAQALLERALGIREKVLGPMHEDVAAALNNLGVLHLARGELGHARLLTGRALEIWKAVGGARHDRVALALNNLACIAEEMSEMAEAFALFEQAAECWGTTLGPYHPDTALAYRNLAMLLWGEGDRPAAREHLVRAARALDRHAATLFFSLAPAEQRELLEIPLAHLSGPLLSLAEDPASAARVYEVVAGGKGLLLEGLRRQSAIARVANDPAHADAVATLQAARTRVAHAVRLGAPREEVNRLEAARERLERSLSQSLPAGALHDPWPADGAEALRALRGALPAGSAFVDLYQHVRWDDGRAVDWRYTGVVTGAGAPPVRVDLGPSAELEAAVDAWRRARERLHAPTAALAERLWTPLAAALPEGTERVWVAPDGALARVPWGVLAAVLPPGAGQAMPLVAQTPSARALLRLLSTDAPGEGGDETVLVVGRVGFGHAPDGGSDTWRDLPATADEVRQVAAAARAAGLCVRRLTGRSATPAAVARGVRTAAYVHLATHGFFGGESRAEYQARQAAAVRERGLLSRSVGASSPSRRSPLSASGLALAGANAGPRGNLTAEEIVGLPLEGARLVVLSACDTGRGAEVTGQGVLGLQAAVQAAGARALLMSLWPVPDAATAELMVTFYRQLWKRARSPAEALLDAQAALRDGGVWPEPVFWAGWSLVGDAFSVAPRGTIPSE